MKRFSLLLVLATLAACSRKDPAPARTSAVVASASPMTIAPMPSATPVIVPSHTPGGEPKQLFNVNVEGVEGATIQDVCSSWKAEVMGVVVREQKAGNGLQGYDEKNVKCTELPAPRIEGTLPDGWSIPTAVMLEFFDGVANKADLYLMLRRKDGRIIGGPNYSSKNDIGDSGSPVAWRVAVMSAAGAKVLVPASVTVEIPSGSWRPDGTPDPAASWKAEFRARICRFDTTSLKCDENRMMVYAERDLTAAEKKDRGASIRPDLPKLDATGHMKALED